MKAVMKSYTKEEGRKHLENWRNGGASKLVYAKSAGIHSTTFFTWVKAEQKKGFVEIYTNRIQIGNLKDIVINKSGFIICIPQSNDIKELQKIFEALGLLK